MRGLNTDSIDMVYLDPPFNSNRYYGDPLSGDGEFKDKWTLNDIDVFEHGEIAEASEAAYRVISATELTQGKGTMAYLIFMAVRLVELQRILKPTGHIFLHCDDTAGHYLKALMDAIFGKRAYRGHITWKRSDANNAASNTFGRITDFIFHYAGPEAKFYPVYVPYDQQYIDKFYKFDDNDGRGRYWKADLSAPQSSPGTKFKWKGFEPPRKGWRTNREGMQRLHDEGRLYYPKNPNGSFAYEKRIMKKSFLDEKEGKKVMNLWVDIVNLRANSEEYLDYPTQKPQELLERIIKCSTSEGDMVFDPFCGCATTLVQADIMQRNWIGCDVSPIAVDKLQDRLAKTVLPMFGNINVFDVRDKDEKGKKLKRKDPLPERTDTGSQLPYRTQRQRLYGEQGGYCFGCWFHHRIELMDVDHRNPKKKGGQDVESNYQLLCSACNRSKGADSMSEWRARKKKNDPHTFKAEEARRREVEEKL